MLRDKLSEYSKTATVSTKDGESFILTKLKKLKPRDSTKSLASTSTDHSISDQDCHSKELLSATVPTTSGSRDGERMWDNNNGTSTRSPRPSRTTTGSLTHSTSNPTVAPQTSDAPLPTQDGGRCSDWRELTSQTREERFWKSKEVLMLRTETLVLTLCKTKSTNNGISSMLMNGRENQLRANLTKDSAYMLKETST